MRETARASAITKTLSGNDTGDTGSHQAGMLVPRDDRILSFFPILDKRIKNPRAIIRVVDDGEKNWDFNYIYYNGVFFGGTRNEYRLTGMTSYIRGNNLRPGDTIILERNEDLIRIRYERLVDLNNVTEVILKDLILNEEPAKYSEKPKTRLVLSSSWKVIRY